MLNKSIIVGLTGQTGAGKSTVARYMEQWGCAVIDADIVAREAVKKGSNCLEALAREFGYDIIENDGELNRRLLAKRAFVSPEKTAVMNSVTHPWILERTKQLAESHKREGKSIIIFDAPLLFESGGNVLCQKIIAVVAPQSVRIARILARDGITKEEAMARMKAQHDEDFYASKADYVIDGSGTTEQTQKQAKAVTEQIKCFLGEQR